MRTDSRTNRRDTKYRVRNQIRTNVARLGTKESFADLTVDDLIRIGNLKSKFERKPTETKRRYPLKVEIAGKEEMDAAKKVFNSNMALIRKALKNPEKVKDPRLRMHLIANRDAIRRKLGIQ